MSQRQHLVDALTTFATVKGLSTSRVSMLVFSDNKVIARLQEGKDITVGRLEAAVQWLSANWPEGTDWPEGIARPQPKPAPQGEAA